MSKFKIKRHAGQQIRINADTVITVVSTTNASVSFLVETAPQNLITIVSGTTELPSSPYKVGKYKVKSSDSDAS